MSAVKHHALARPDPTPAQPVAGERLDWLRRIGAACRCGARTDLFRACAVLSEDRDTAAEAYARALLGALPTGRLRFYQPGTHEVSFDEAWLVSLLDAAGRGDEASLTFLLARRLPAHTRRSVGYLVMNLSRKLDIAA